VNNPTSTTIDVTINVGDNPSDVLYEIYEVNTGKYVQSADGTLGNSADWQTASTWGTFSGVNGKITVTGLLVDTRYSFVITPKSAGGEEADPSSAVALYTLANAPVSLSASIDLMNGVTVTYGANGNPGTTNYYVTGISGSTSVSGWTLGLTWLDGSAKTESTYYCYSVKAKNGDGVETSSVLLSGESCARQAGGLAWAPSASSSKSTSKSEKKSSGQDVAETENTSAAGQENSAETVEAEGDGQSEGVAGVGTESSSVDSVGGSSGAGGQYFADIQDSSVKDLIEEYASIGIVNGRGGSDANETVSKEFDPVSYINRAEAMKIIAKLLNLPEGSGDESVFSDVQNEWYAEYVNACSENGLVFGYTDGRFGPGDNITRVEALKVIIFARGLKLIVPDTLMPTLFVDVPKGGWYESVVFTAYANLMLGDYLGNEKLNPGEFITREEFVKMTQGIFE
jgi:hypothetical protein